MNKDSTVAGQAASGKVRGVPAWVATALIAGAIGLLVLGMIGLLVLARAGARPGAPVGTPVKINATAHYVDDGGAPVVQNGGILGVEGLRVTFDDGRGSSGAAVTEVRGRFVPAHLDMLTGHTYIITASFNGSVLSTQATIAASRVGYFGSGVTNEGVLDIKVSIGDGHVVSVGYARGAPQ